MPSKGPTGSYTVRVPKNATTGRFVSQPESGGRIEVRGEGDLQVSPCTCIGCYIGYECNNIWYGEPEESTFEQTAGPYQAIEELRDNVEKLADAYMETRDAVHPEHYKQHPTGIEAIDIIEHASSPNLANVIKYVWRVLWGSKGKDLEDLRKAHWYLQREIEKRSLK